MRGRKEGILNSSKDFAERTGLLMTRAEVTVRDEIILVQIMNIAPQQITIYAYLKTGCLTSCSRVERNAESIKRTSENRRHQGFRRSHRNS
ncbi:unnamed protein product [Soboliphyme baturini]|uniref:PAS domain-containing protein n=1 Tax=Soboliphyme baturini TaxID=241478 RepID=A0A183IU94_9BILA|nr:unnamed protein product [Soboliphyme baturini]